MHHPIPFDIIIIGGSYAGLSAAMTLGRSRRQVLVIDNDRPCNRQTPHAHNLIAHDGDRPAEIAQKAKAQVQAYPTVTFASGTATAVSGVSGAFEVKTDAGVIYTAKRLLLATGVQDVPMPVPGFAECWGISVLHCPYCHGYEVADLPVGVIANGEMAFEFGRLVHHWSKDLTLFTNGPVTMPEALLQQLQAKGIRVVAQELAAIAHRNGYLHHLQFRDGTSQPLKAIFARGGTAQYPFVASAGCGLHTEGMFAGLIRVDEFGKTTVPGIYAAGDNCSPMRSLSMAMSSGMKAGAMLNHELIAAEF